MSTNSETQAGARLADPSTEPHPNFGKVDAQRSVGDFVVDLLVAGGFVAAEKAEEARKIALNAAPVSGECNGACRDAQRLDFIADRGQSVRQALNGHKNLVAWEIGANGRAGLREAIDRIDARALLAASEVKS